MQPPPAVAEVMDRGVVAVPPGMGSTQMILLMGLHECAELVVVDPENRPLGVVHHSALVPVRSADNHFLHHPVRSLVGGRRRWPATAAEAMTAPVATVPGDVSLGAAARTLAATGADLVAVVDAAGRLVGAVRREHLARTAVEFIGQVPRVALL